MWLQRDIEGKDYKDSWAEFCSRHHCHSSWKLSSGGEWDLLKVWNVSHVVAAEVSSEFHVLPSPLSPRTSLSARSSSSHSNQL